MSNIGKVGGSGRMGRTGQSGKAGRVGSEKAAAEASTDQLHLSLDAQALAELRLSLDSMGDIDEIRVEAIRKAIQDDRLPIDYDLLAEKMLALQDELKDL